jgi:hypothetical protein
VRRRPLVDRRWRSARDALDRVGDDLYVRSWKGDGGAWFRAAQGRHEGHINVGGVGKDVTFVAQADADINQQIDAAYRTKYRRHGGRYVDPMVAPYGARHDDQARTALVLLGSQNG